MTNERAASGSAPKWIASGDVDDNTPDHSRLHAMIEFPDFALHMQAYEVKDGENGWEAAYDAWHDEVEALYTLYPDTALVTTEIGGRVYFVCAHPLGD